jgi:DNA-binding NtrC family response regulator
MAKLIGSAPSFLRATEQIPAVARTEAPVLISGESGTGKELVARAIHYLSERVPYPFVAVNCGSLPDTLLEDELFGHERGAFTSAHMRREGLIAQANRGTLFLDEVDTLAAKGQVDFLRVVEEKKFRAIGSSLEQEADVRIVAATNVPLDQLLQFETFRADLYYRLSIFTINLPPLRSRREDIPALAAHFLQKHAPADNRTPKLSPNAYAALLSWNWPGNVRELESAIVRGIHLSRADSIEVEDLGLQPSIKKASAAAPPTPGQFYSFRAMKREAIRVFEREYLVRLIAEHQGNVTQAARTAGKERRDLGKLLKRHGLDPKSFRSRPSSSNPGGGFVDCKVDSG